METSGDRDFQERRTGPTVSKDKWVNHARAKMLRGYVLIIGNERRTANFYLAGKGYEMCPYNVAKQLVKEGLVTKAGDHNLGSVYRLTNAEPAAEPAAEPKARRQRVVEEEDTLLDELEQDDPDASVVE